MFGMGAGTGDDCCCSQSCRPCVSRPQLPGARTKGCARPPTRACLPDMLQQLCGNVILAWRFLVGNAAQRYVHLRCCKGRVQCGGAGVRINLQMLRCHSHLKLPVLFRFHRARWLCRLRHPTRVHSHRIRFAHGTHRHSSLTTVNRAAHILQLHPQLQQHMLPCRCCRAGAQATTCRRTGV
jgi:hypothetical protein